MHQKICDLPVMATMRHQVYVAGGVGEEGLPLHSMEVLDIRLGQWARMQEMREPREGFGMTVLDGCIFVAGGHNEGGAATSSVEVRGTPSLLWVLVVGDLLHCHVAKHHKA